jgi:hypothetical protein
LLRPPTAPHRSENSQWPRPTWRTNPFRRMIPTDWTRAATSEAQPDQAHQV